MQRRLGVHPKSPKSRQPVWAAVPLTLLMCSETNITPNYPHRHIPFYGFKKQKTNPETTVNLKCDSGRAAFKSSGSQMRGKPFSLSKQLSRAGLGQRRSAVRLYPGTEQNAAVLCYTLGDKGGSTCLRSCKSSSCNFLHQLPKSGSWCCNQESTTKRETFSATLVMDEDETWTTTSGTVRLGRLHKDDSALLSVCRLIALRHQLGSIVTGPSCLLR